MADAQRGDDFPEDDDDGGGESTVSMASPTLDPAVPLPISVPPPAMPGGPGGMHSIPTAPTPFTPQAPPAFPMGGAAPVGHKPPSFGQPTPVGGVTPTANIGKPIPAAGSPPPSTREPVMSGQATGAGGVIAGMKRPVTVIGLAPPPVGAPRPGQAGARVPLPSGKGPTPAAGMAPAAPRPAAGAPATAAAPLSEKNPPSSAKGVKPPSQPQPIGAVAGATAKDADSTDEQFALNPRDSIPDSQKEDMATMAKSPEESLALFGLSIDGPPKPTPAAGGPPPVPPSGRSPLASTNLAQSKPPAIPASRPGIPVAPPPLPAAGAPPEPPPAELPVLHDRSEEEESTRAVSREEMLRGHDAVVIGDDSDMAQGEDATLAVAPGFNESAKQLHLLQQQLAAEQSGMPSPLGGPDPYPQPQGFAGHPPTMQSAQGWNPQQPVQHWQDPNAGANPFAAPAAGSQGHQSYPGMSVGPVSGPHMPAQSWTPNAPPSQPHFPGAPPQGGPQSQPHMQVPQSGQMMAGQQQQGAIPYPGQPNFHQPPSNPFGDWNANAPQQQQLGKPKFKISGQILLLGIVGVVCLAIFITGIVLFATTKF